MEGALVKLLGNLGLFRVTGNDKEKAKIDTQDKMKMLLKAGKLVNFRSGEELEDTTIHNNQIVIAYPEIDIVPTKYHCIVSFNPELSDAGIIVNPYCKVVSPGIEGRIALILQSYKKVDLSEFDHIFELYQID